MRGPVEAGERIRAESDDRQQISDDAGACTESLGLARKPSSLRKKEKQKANLPRNVLPGLKPASIL
jgi:hypothetical protein